MARSLRNAQGASDNGRDVVPPATNDAASAADLQPDATAFVVVGIGTSTGGLDSLLQLLGGLPADTGMAFVVVQHADPGGGSLHSEQLARATPIPTAQAENNVTVEPNHVYVIPRTATWCTATDSCGLARAAGSAASTARSTDSCAHSPKAGPSARSA